MRSGLRLIGSGLAAVIGMAGLGMPSPAAAADWYVVVGSFRESSTNASASADRLQQNVQRRCGGNLQWDYSVKFHNFAPGYLVVFSGPYGSKSRAQRVRGQLAPCAPDAYVKSSTYAGE